MSNEDQKPAEAPIAERGSYRSHRPHGPKFLAYISANWADRDNSLPARAEMAPMAKSRRAVVADKFAGKVLLIHSGAMKQRSNDTEYRYRPHAAFTHLTGWGSVTVPDSVLVIDTRHSTQTVYLRETAGRDSEEFYANSAIGEFWLGPRPTLAQVSALLDIDTKALGELDDFRAGLHDSEVLTLENEELVEFLSEMRFVKDALEIAEMRKAVAASVKGFEEVAKNLHLAVGHHRGERVVETSFFSQARIEGYDLGYETIAAAGHHACILHWMVNDGPIKDGDLLLLDAGVEVDSLYTADITRTIPVNGKYTEAQRRVYDAVLKAADAVFAIAKPGLAFRELHAEAMRVIAETVAEWGFIKISPEESLKPENQLHRRWMVHGTSHHLGLDVHDCAQAKRDLYLDQVLTPGMIFTIEPGLYFQPDDLMVPAELRGIGVRIEDNVLVTETGVENLSAALPRTAVEVEKWLAKLS